MDIVLSGLTYPICLCYLEDVIVFGRDIKEHCERLETVLLGLREHNLRVKLSKCKIAERQVAFLGHVISKSGIQSDPVNYRISYRSYIGSRQQIGRKIVYR